MKKAFPPMILPMTYRCSFCYAAVIKLLVRKEEDDIVSAAQLNYVECQMHCITPEGVVW